MVSLSTFGRFGAIKKQFKNFRSWKAPKLARMAEMIQPLEPRQMLAATPVEIANALDLPDGTAVTYIGHKNAVAVGMGTKEATFLDFPTGSNDQFLVLSTGTAIELFTPPASGLSSTDFSPGGVNGDEASVAFSVSVPASMSMYKFDFSFLSEEFPDFVGTKYNDIFSVKINGQEVAFDSNGNPLTISGALFDGEDAEPTTFNARTSILTGTYVIPDGTKTLNVTLTIKDIEDGALDSAVVVDNFRFVEGQTVFVDFDGGTAANFYLDGTQMKINGVSDVSAKIYFGADYKAQVLAALKEKFSAFNIKFVTVEPTSGNYMTVLVGDGTSSVHVNYDAGLGLAEDVFRSFVNTLDADYATQQTLLNGGSVTWSEFDAMRGVTGPVYGKATGIDVGNKTLSDKAVVFAKDIAQAFVPADFDGDGVTQQMLQTLLVQVIAQEVGHNVGLSDVSNSGSLMSDDLATRTPEAEFLNTDLAISPEPFGTAPFQNDYRVLAGALGLLPVTDPLNPTNKIVPVTIAPPAPVVIPLAPVSLVQLSVSETDLANSFGISNEDVSNLNQVVTVTTKVTSQMLYEIKQVPEDVVSVKEMMKLTILTQQPELNNYLTVVIGSKSLISKIPFFLVNEYSMFTLQYLHVGNSQGDYVSADSFTLDDTDSIEIDQVLVGGSKAPTKGLSVTKKFATISLDDEEEPFVPNHAPTFTATSPAVAHENQPAITVTGWATFNANDDGQKVLGYTVDNISNPGLFSYLPEVDNDGTLVYTPAPGMSGTSTFTVKVRDSGGTLGGGVNTSTAQTFTITVNPISHAPVVTGVHSESTWYGRGETARVTADGFTDIDGDSITGVTFYADVNNNGTFEAGTDTKLGVGTNSANKWSLDFATTDYSLGSHRVFAIATDSGSTAHGGVVNSAPVAASFTILRGQGVVSGQNYIAYQDSAGSKVKVIITGPSSGDAMAFFSTELGDRNSPEYLRVSGTDASKSMVEITVTGTQKGAVAGLATTIGSVIIHGGLSAFKAETTSLAGSFTADGFIKALQLDDVIGTGERSIRFGGTSADTATVTAGNIQDISFNTTATVTSFKAENWSNTNSTADSFEASKLGSLTISGRAGKAGTPALAGDFDADIKLTYVLPTAGKTSVPAPSVTGITIAGSTTGSWNVGASKLGAVTIKGSASGTWKGNTTLGALAVSGSASGLHVIAGTDITSFKAGQVSNGTTIAAGGAVGAVTVIDWSGGWISAGKLASLTTSGRAEVKTKGVVTTTKINGDFSGDLNITGVSTLASGATMGAITIKGAVTGDGVAPGLAADWNFSGGVGAIKADSISGLVVATKVKGNNLGNVASLSVTGAASNTTWYINNKIGAVTVGSADKLSLQVASDITSFTSKGTVTGTGLFAGNSIGAVTSVDWTGGYLNTGKIASITTKGQAEVKTKGVVTTVYNAGNFSGMVTAQGLLKTASTLGPVSIKGQLGANKWTISGGTGTFGAASVSGLTLKTMNLGTNLGSLGAFTVAGAMSDSTFTVSGKQGTVTVGSASGLTVNVAGEAGAFTSKGAVTDSAVTVGGKAGAFTAVNVTDFFLKVTGELVSFTSKGSVNDSNLDVTAGVGAISVQEWLTGSIKAGKVTSITTVGRKEVKAKNGDVVTPALAGDFTGEVTITGVTKATTATLGSATIAGSLSSTQWNITGNSGLITVKGAIDEFTMTTLALDAKNAGNITGIKTAGEMTSVTVTTAGKFGDLTAGNVTDSAFVIAGDLASVSFGDSMRFLNSSIRTGGSINRLSLGIIDNSQVFVGVRADVTDLPTAKSAFVADSGARIQILLIGGSESPVVNFINSIIAAPEIKAIKIKGTSELASGVEGNSGIAAGLVAKYERYNAEEPIAFHQLSTPGELDSMPGYVLRIVG